MPNRLKPSENAITEKRLPDLRIEQMRRLRPSKGSDVSKATETNSSSSH